MNYSETKRLPYWRAAVARALKSFDTPFYIFSPHPYLQSLRLLETELKPLPLPTRHWLSYKTQPLPALLNWWRHRDGLVEVVSEFELLGVLKMGFNPHQILVNGPTKHTWLFRYPIEGLNVNFDSIAEVKYLRKMARQLRWRIGVRFLTAQESDLEGPQYPTQFGVSPEELPPLLKLIQRDKLQLKIVHFHLRTNVSRVDTYFKALDEVRTICQSHGITPEYLDCGGGLPPGFVTNHHGQHYNRDFNLEQWREMLKRILGTWEGLRELWFENGRFLSAGAGVLVGRVNDVKQRRGMRHLICDAGRTNHALVGTWEDHEMLVHPRRTGPETMTTISGPTCMAFDRLARRSFPTSIRQGDALVWLDAGAYHLSWENHFSHGLARVLWFQDDDLICVREPETFAQSWSRWNEV